MGDWSWFDEIGSLFDQFDGLDSSKQDWFQQESIIQAAYKINHLIDQEIALFPDGDPKRIFIGGIG